MAWQADQESNRTFDPEAGYELLSTASFRGGPTKFRLLGPEDCFDFSASKMEAPITDAERAVLGLSDAVVWTIIYEKGESDERKAIITNALKAYKLGHGFNLGELAVFVRFGKSGTIADD